MLNDDEFQIIDIDSYTVGIDAARARIHSMQAALKDMHEPLKQIVDEMYTSTREWMDSWGDGTYDPLSPSTIANKTRMGVDDPTRPLFQTGELLESASTGEGPYSVHDLGGMEAWIGVDWERDGWNIAALHQTGVPWRIVHRRGYFRRDGKYVSATSYLWHLPSRPIYHVDEALLEAAADEIVEHVWNPMA